MNSCHKLRLTSAFFCVLTLLMLLSGFLGYSYDLGFPDGHITDYQRQMNLIYKMVTIPVLGLAGYFAYLSVNSHQHNLSAKLKASIAIGALIFIFFVISDNYVYQNLNHGQGG